MNNTQAGNQSINASINNIGTASNPCSANINNVGTASNPYGVSIGDYISTTTATDATTGVITISPGKWVTDKYYEEQYKAINKIIDWLIAEHEGQLGANHTCNWSNCIGGFEIKAYFSESTVINSTYALSIQVKPITEPGKILISKDIYFSTDNAVYEWFKEHDIYKLFSLLENDLKTYYTSYRNLITSIDLELNL